MMGSMTIVQALDEAKREYVARHPHSSAAAPSALASMPGGNTRTTLFFDPFPVVFAHARRQILTCVDGHDYVDFLGDFTAGMFGHSNPTIIGALHAALDEGISFGGHNEYERRLADQITRRFPSIELVRFTNSGTEANLLALAAAVAQTGRSTIIVFSAAGSSTRRFNVAKPGNIELKWSDAQDRDRGFASS